MTPRLNPKRALFVLTKIDEILAWEKRKEAEKDTRFVELRRYLREVRAGQYWRGGKVGVVRRFSGKTVSGVEKEGVLPHVNTRTSAARGEAQHEAGGLDERSGAREVSEKEGWSGLRLCNLVAQSAASSERGLSPRGREGVDWERLRALGAALFQDVQ